MTACLRCGGAMIPILRGHPTYEMHLAVERGDAVHAGCMTGDDDPEWSCRDCRATR